MLTSTELIAKRNSILNTIVKAKDELITLDAEVAASITANKEQFAALIRENEALTDIKSNNAVSIKALSKILANDIHSRKSRM